jgi:hypothetical protein
MSLKDDAKKAEADLRESLHGCTDALKQLTMMARYACELKDTLKLRTEDVTRLTDENGFLRNSRATLENQLAEANTTIESLRQQLRGVEYKLQNVTPAAVAAAAAGWKPNTARVLVDVTLFDTFEDKPCPSDMPVNRTRAIVQTPLQLGMGSVAKMVPTREWLKRNERLFAQWKHIYFQDMLEILRQSAPLLTASPLSSKSLHSTSYMSQDPPNDRVPKRNVAFVTESPASYDDLTHDMKLGLFLNPVFPGLPGIPQALAEKHWLDSVMGAVKRYGFRQIMVDMIWLLQQTYGVPGKHLGYYQERGGQLVQEYQHRIIDDLTEEEMDMPLYSLPLVLSRLADVSYAAGRITYDRVLN